MVDELYADRFQPSLHESLGTLHELQVFLDGHFLSGEEARLSVWDHALFYGDGIFEGIRAYNGRVFKLEEHLTRLWNSAKAMALAIPLSQDEMSHVIRETLHRNGLQEAHIRAIVTRGTGRPGLDPRRAVRPSVLVLAYPFPPQLGGKPVRVILSSIRRKSPHSIDSRIKSLNYLDSILAKLQATASGDVFVRRRGRISSS
jgi:branched-chain amino acid aminotransferase